MYYTARHDYVVVVGGIWMPYGATCSMRRDLSDYDLENIGEFTRENVERWVDTNMGGFSTIIDLHATAGHEEIPWATEDGEVAYLDTLGTDD